MIGARFRGNVHSECTRDASALERISVTHNAEDTRGEGGALWSQPRRRRCYL